MPIGISDFNILKQEVDSDIKNNFDESKHQHLKSAIPDIKEKVITFGRQPRLHNEYTKIEKMRGYAIYRKWVGSSLARFFFAIKGEEMTLIAVLPKDDDTYKFADYHNRVYDL